MNEHSEERQLAATNKLPVERTRVRLEGCRPTPLAHYLKALAILRILARQAPETNPRGAWDDGVFVIESASKGDEIKQFFLHAYQPTPIVSPWNGGSGMKLNKLKDDVTAIRDANAERLRDLSAAVRTALELLDSFGFDDGVPKPAKTDFLRACRATFSERTLEWLDATYVLTTEDPKYPPLLGTGGNDGNLDFSINYLSRIAQLFDVESGEPTLLCEAWLDASLFAALESHLDTSAIGQFFPQASGGANAETGFDSGTVSNPWDFVLMLEGAMTFTAAASKKLESSNSGALSAPFCVRHVGVGHGSASTNEEADARGEIWMPIWSRPAAFHEVHTLMTEGRAQVGRRPARNGLDFVRAVGTLGVDRGIDAFQRFGFQMRNGRAFHATPMGRIQVERRPEADLIAEIDGWLDRFRSSTSGDSVPGSIKSASRRLQTAAFEMCQFGQRHRIERVLIELGASERALARSHRWTISSYVRPLSGLSERWIERANDESPEFRMAMALASVYASYPTHSSVVSIRTNFEPVKMHRSGRADWRQESSPDVVWQPGDPIAALNNIVHRRIVKATMAGAKTWPDRAKARATLTDVAYFIEGRLDTQRIVDLAWGLLAVDWRRVTWNAPSDDYAATPDALYLLMKLCHSGISTESAMIPIEPRIHRYAAAGDGERASRAAARRLRGSGFIPKFDVVDLRGARAQRAAAALIFPVYPRPKLVDLGVQGTPEDYEEGRNDLNSNHGDS